MRPKIIISADGREIPSAAPVRACALDDCRRAECLYAIGDAIGGDDAIDLAIGMLRTAWKLDGLRGEGSSSCD